MKDILGLVLGLAVATGTRLSLAPSQAKAAEYKRNASFLNRSFLTDSKNAAGLAGDFLTRTDKFYKTPFS